MSLGFRTGVCAAVVTAACLVSGLRADQGAAMRYRPSVPRLGFQSYFTGSGERVTRVTRGSTASDIGLEPGDVIVSVNGFRLRYEGAWRDAMEQAVDEGHIVLAVRDWRTGRTVYCNVDLGGSDVHLHSRARE